MEENVSFDVRAILKALIDHNVTSEMKNNPQIKPVVEVLEKYGVKGIDALTCLTELGMACKNIGKDNDL